MVRSLARAAPIVQRLGVWLAWWAALAAVWMLLVDTRSTAEFAACGGVSLAGLLLTWLVSRQHVADLRLRHALLLTVPRQAAAVPGDLARLAGQLVLALLGRRPTGRFYSLPFDDTNGPLANGRRAAIELIGSIAPNAIVLGVDDEQVIVHQLADRASARRRVEEMA
jgi:hypothetical protein